MKKLIHYILIGIMLNWNVAVLADSHDGCSNWQVVEETDKSEVQCRATRPEPDLGVSSSGLGATRTSTTSPSSPKLGTRSCRMTFMFTSRP